MTRNTIRLVRLAAGLIAGAVVLTGCSDGGSTGSTAQGSDSSAGQSAEFNDADVAFAQAMIVHHQGAIEMAKLADGRAADPRVLDLAGRIEAAQDPEIKTMTGWLEDWGQPTSAPKSDSMGGMEGMEGMDNSSGMEMSGEDRSALEAASGADFDRMWLQMMIKHHQGAVDMSQTEGSEGQNAEAVALAEQIISSQSAEIAEMETILSELGG